MSDAVGTLLANAAALVLQIDRDELQVGVRSARRALAGWLHGEVFLYNDVSGGAFPVAIDPETCQRVTGDAGDIVQRMETERAPGDLATPGDVCTACEFRPWRRPFWRWQSSEVTDTAALDRARVGFEGQVTGIEVVDQHWKVLVQWREVTVRLVTPLERFPHLRRVQVGARLRVMDARSMACVGSHR